MYGSVYIDDALTDHSLNDGLVARYCALPGQQRGVNFRDLLRKYDSTIVNGLTWVGGRRRGGYGALSFDGSDDYSVTASQVGPDTFTASAWVYFNSIASTGTILGKGNSGLEGWLLRYFGGSSEVFNLTVRSAGGAYDSVSTTYGSPLGATGTWFHCVIWHDSGSSIGISVNGFRTTKSYSAGIYNASSPFTFGRYPDTSTQYLNGLLDDVCLWNRVLSAADIKELYQEQLRGSPETLKWYKRKAYSLIDAGGGGNRRRRCILGGAA